MLWNQNSLIHIFIIYLIYYETGINPSNVIIEKIVKLNQDLIIHNKPRGR